MLKLMDKKIYNFKLKNFVYLNLCLGICDKYQYLSAAPYALNMMMGKYFMNMCSNNSLVLQASGTLSLTNANMKI